MPDDATLPRCHRGHGACERVHHHCRTEREREPERGEGGRSAGQRGLDGLVTHHPRGTAIGHWPSERGTRSEHVVVKGRGKGVGGGVAGIGQDIEGNRVGVGEGRDRTTSGRGGWHQLGAGSAACGPHRGAQRAGCPLQDFGCRRASLHKRWLLQTGAHVRGATGTLADTRPTGRKQTGGDDDDDSNAPVARARVAGKTSRITGDYVGRDGHEHGNTQRHTRTQKQYLQSLQCRGAIGRERGAV